MTETKFDGKWIDICKNCGSSISRTDWCRDKHNENCIFEPYVPISKRTVEKNGYIIDNHVSKYKSGKPIFPKSFKCPKKFKIIGYCGCCGHVLIETAWGDGGHDRCLQPHEAMLYMLDRRMLIEDGKEIEDGEYTLCELCKWPMVRIEDRKQGHHIDSCATLESKLKLAEGLDGRVKETYFRMIDYKGE